MQRKKLECPSADIAAYIDGEFDLTRELQLDQHFSECSVCANELNRQKQFLCELDSSLKHEAAIDLPADFTKTIVANAESTVSGLRRPRERFNALFICAGLVLFVLFALGSDAARVLDGVSLVFEKVIAIGVFFGHCVYSAFLGFAVILRAFAAQFRFEAMIPLFLALCFVVSIMLVSRRLLRIRL